MLLLLRRTSILVLLLTSRAVFSIDQDTVELKQISTHVWIHTSYGMVSGALTDAHGVIIVNNHKTAGSCHHRVQIERNRLAQPKNELRDIVTTDLS